MKKNVKKIIEEIVIDLNEELLSRQEARDGTERIASTSKNKYKLSEIKSSDYEEDYDHDHEASYHRHEARPTNFDQIETLDNAVTWALKSRFQIKSFHLLVCVARNEIGDSAAIKIIIPSDLDNGKPYRVSLIKEGSREATGGDNLDESDINGEEEVVQGETFLIEYAYNNVLFQVYFVSLYAHGHPFISFKSGGFILMLSLGFV